MANKRVKWYTSKPKCQRSNQRNIKNYLDTNEKITENVGIKAKSVI